MSEAFDDWLDDFFRSYFRRRPVCATFVGAHDHDHRLPDVSDTGVSTSVDELTDLERRLGSIPEDRLTDAQQIDRELAEGALRIQRWEVESDHYLRKNPAFYTGKAIFGVMSLFLRDYAPVEERVPAAIDRMSAIPGFLETATENLEGVPAGWEDRALDECDAAVAFFEDGIEQLAADHGVEDPEFVESGTVAAGSFAEFREAIERADTVADGHACGRGPLERILSEGHHFDRSIQELVDGAWEELERCENYLEEHATEFDAETPEEALGLLADRHPSAEDYYEQYREVWEECRSTAEGADVLTWPEYPVEFVPRPEWCREAARDLYFLFYRSPAAFDDVTPVEYLVEPVEPEMDDDETRERLRRNNDSQIKLNHVAHHAATGHHVQNWNAYNNADSRIGRVAATDCASRIAFYAGGTMAEGWACYATELMDELDFLSPLESYSLRNSRLRFASRAIVDLELHRGELSHDEAVEFYRDRIGMSEAAASYEATRNGMFPGMAVMYLRPLQVVHELREEFESELGSEFDLGRFHDEFLSYGSIPVTMIADRMRSDRLR
jgi:uncharacterized protein (DUF885 family)